MKGSLLILTFFTAGVLLSYFDTLPDCIATDQLSFYTLLSLVFLVGFSIGTDKDALKILTTINLKTALIPISIALGSILGAGVCGLLINTITPREAMAVGAGLGYYSLSSIIISEISGEKLSIVALLANIYREVFTLVAAPILIKLFGKMATIASGGATSMDSTLPVVIKYSGKDYTILALFSGIVLTILVPILVSFILNF